MEGWKCNLKVDWFQFCFFYVEGIYLDLEFFFIWFWVGQGERFRVLKLGEMGYLDFQEQEVFFMFLEFGGSFLGWGELRNGIVGVFAFQVQGFGWSYQLWLGLGSREVFLLRLFYFKQELSKFQLWVRGRYQVNRGVGKLNMLLVATEKC